MSLKNCPECRKLFVETPTVDVCADCMRKEEDEFDKVAQFMRDHGRASVDVIHEATGVKHKIIMKMVKRGRLEGNFEINWPCKKCGHPITCGELCETCAKTLADHFRPQTAWKPPDVKLSERKEGKMYSGVFEKNK